VRAAQQLTAEDEAHPDAGPDVREGEVVDLAAVAQGAFGQGGGVHVVLQDQRRPERLPQSGQRRRAVPAAQAAGELQGVAARVIDAGTADHGLGDGRTGHVRVLAQQVGQLHQLGDPGPDAGGVSPHRGLGPDLTGEVGDRAADVVMPDVQAQDQPGVGPDLVQPGRTAGHPGSLSGDANQAGPLDVVQSQGHGRLGQAGDAGQLGSGARPALADVLEQQLLVHRPDQRGTRREQAGPGCLGRNTGRPLEGNTGRRLGGKRLRGKRSRRRTPGERARERIVRHGCHGDLLHHCCARDPGSPRCATPALVPDNPPALVPDK
jgi:hypothetical protein